jgi:hypothetical protein
VNSEVRIAESRKDVSLRPHRRIGRPRTRVAGLPRARGGQPGNRNRWRHGAFSAAARAARLADDAALRRIEALIAETLAAYAKDDDGGMASRPSLAAPRRDGRGAITTPVIAGLVPATHDRRDAGSSWMAGTRPAMTMNEKGREVRRYRACFEAPLSRRASA